MKVITNRQGDSFNTSKIIIEDCNGVRYRIDDVIGGGLAINKTDDDETGTISITTGNGCNEIKIK